MNTIPLTIPEGYQLITERPFIVQKNEFGLNNKTGFFERCEYAFGDSISELDPAYHWVWIRPIPKPKQYRPWTSEEAVKYALGGWLKDEQNIISFIVAIDGSSFIVWRHGGFQRIDLSWAVNNIFISLDRGQTWNKCGMEVV